MGAPVLIVAGETDFHATAVASILRSDLQVEAEILDLAEFPTISGEFWQTSGCSSSKLKHCALQGARSIWWRRPQPSSPPVALEPSQDAFRRAECDGFVQGLLWSLGATWVNHPGRQLVASRKICQLQAAKAAGFNVPETLITNDPAAALEFLSGQTGQVIYKRTGTSAGDFAPTRLFDRTDFARLSGIRSSPTIFQEYIDAECDIRVVWIAGIAWAVRIDSQNGIGRVDSRLDNSVAFTPYELPVALTFALDALMHQLDLVFAVVDLRISARDRAIYFLEINPQGQFAYLELKTGLPIFRSLATFLAGQHIG